MTISIWGQLPGKAAEVIDRASSVQEARYLVGQYRMAFGPQWKKIWYGRKDGTLPEKKKRLSYWEYKCEQARV
jgi:hypothetical protein